MYIPITRYQVSLVSFYGKILILAVALVFLFGNIGYAIFGEHVSVYKGS